MDNIYGKSAGPRRPITPYQKKGPSRPTGTSKGGACGAVATRKHITVHSGSLIQATTLICLLLSQLLSEFIRFSTAVRRTSSIPSCV
ncbi:hypothetical protein K443DRAFT_594887 [Laccaria amethystina LaAM-08-1]|uniref:Unplaced genomic scaffold K443scaffold_83, whole genome shotgun sequence n=1 Tax=Laccaria amethystina LaAM-08-1 TaxID=1095629 RepID=A0A0C9WQX3_9AGAR|nr:hypothetical protein K443DRAFT_594887 [Laccaria amethystina LaAM-08-1]